MALKAMEFKNVTEHYLDPELVEALKQCIAYYCTAYIVSVTILFILFLLIMIFLVRK